MLAQRVETAEAGYTLPNDITYTLAAQHIARAVHQQTGRAGAQRIQAQYPHLALHHPGAIRAALG